MLFFLILATIFCGGSLAFTPVGVHCCPKRQTLEWKEAIIRIGSKWDEHVNQKNVEGVLSLYTDKMDEIEPNRPAMDKNEFRTFLKWLFGHYSPNLAIQFRELIYSSDDVAIERHDGVETSAEGVKTYMQGMRLLIMEGNEVKIRLSICNNY